MNFVKGWVGDELVKITLEVFQFQYGLTRSLV